MRYALIAFMLSCFVASSSLAAKQVPDTEADVISKIIKESWGEIEDAPEIYPHFFVYGLEVEATAGIGDVAEVGTSLGVELHFERSMP